MFYREAGIFKTSYAADMAMLPLPSTRWAAVAFAVLFIVVVPLVCDEYTLSILNLILIAVVGAIGLNILVGYTDQVSIGQGAFMSVGAYTAAHLITQLDAPFWIAVPAGGLMAALIGALVGIPSLRIKGLYLAIATLAAQLIIEWTINHVPWVSGGTQATIQVPPPSVFGTKLTSAWQMYLFLMFFVVLAMVGRAEPDPQPHRPRLHRDPRPGHRRRDHRHQHLPLQAAGRSRSPRSTPASPACCTPTISGIANYEQFQLDVSINFLAMVIIGGLGSTLGPDLRRGLRHAAADRHAARAEFGRRPVLRGPSDLSAISAEPAARDLRRADHLLSGRGAGRPEPAVAQHPDLVPDVAVFLLNQAQQGRAEMRHRDSKEPGVLAGCDGRACGSLARATRSRQGNPDRRAMRPHRADPDRRHGVLPGGAGLREPDQFARAASTATRSSSTSWTTTTRCRRRSRNTSGTSRKAWCPR